MARDFTEKVVLVSGSSAGIGEAIAVTFARLGASVVVTGRNGDNVKRVANECQSVSPKGLKPLEVIADVTNDDDIRRLLNETVEKFGRIDILVNNAGVGGITHIDDENLMEDFDRIMRTNLRAVVLLTHLAVPYLEIAKGNIVNISSIAGVRPDSIRGVYCMSKTALDMFTKCLAVELGPKGIRVNSVDPGLIRTDFQAYLKISAAEMDAFRRTIASLTPLGVIGEPQDIANAVEFLASADASFITGTCLLSDGGIVLGKPS